MGSTVVATVAFPTITRAWNTFFRAKINEETLRWTGYLRIFLALIFLYDQALWTLDRQWIMSPSQGLVMKYRERGELEEYHGYHSLLSLAPDSDTWMWCIHFGGILCGILFLLGMAPKVSLLGMYASCVSFQNLTYLPFDMQDSMLRLWCFGFCFCRCIASRYGMDLGRLFPPINKQRKQRHTASGRIGFVSCKPSSFTREPLGES